MLVKAELCRRICEQVGVTRRNPKSGNLSKKELMHLTTYLSVRPRACVTEPRDETEKKHQG